MKTISKRRKSGLTLVELMVVIVVLAVLASMLLPALSKAKGGSHSIYCVNDLKEVGIAYGVWAGDNGNLLPFQQKISLGGWADLLTDADQGANCWTNYTIMGNDMGQSPKLVLCPQDERTNVASSFNPTASKTSNPIGFGNITLSYFVGVAANPNSPQAILGGDRNLGPGVNADKEYGYSPKNGQGNDVAIPSFGLVSWSVKMHSAGKPFGAGNILLGDGSAQQVSSIEFDRTYLRNAPPTTNWPAGRVPASPSIRLVFP